jgi:hypothetical protein
MRLPLDEKRREGRRGGGTEGSKARKERERSLTQFLLDEEKKRGREGGREGGRKR